MKQFEHPQNQSFHLNGVKHVQPSEVYDALCKGEAVLIDVREQDEVVNEFVPMDTVLNHPMSVILERLQYIPKNQQLVLACPGGVRSVKVANLLQLQGYPQVANLDGGLLYWKMSGFPYEISQKNAGCGCGCQKEEKEQQPT